MRAKTVIRRIDELINDDGYTAYDKLPDDLRDELTALATCALGKNAYEVLVECKHSEINIDHLIHFLLNGDDDSAWKLAITLRNNAVDYFANDLSALFDERFGELDAERKAAGGLHPITDPINGETRWIR